VLVIYTDGLTPRTMSTFIHAILSLTIMCTINYLIYFQPASFIGFIHGPSAQLAALHQHQFINTFLSAQDANENDCDAYATSHAESSWIRDAAMIASIFIMILILVPGFASFNFTKKQRACFLLLLPLLWVTPGLISQILSAQIPIELSYLTAYGVNGIQMVQYCSLHSLVSGHQLTSTLQMIMYEMKLAGVAAGMLFLLMGIMPVEK
jgi:hypothetical protein